MSNLHRLLVPALLLAVAACVSAKTTPLADIPKITSLEDLMDNQATTADPQMKKAGQGAYTDLDYAAFAETATRIDATSTKLKDFAKGRAEFDGFATQLNAAAKSLGAAAAAKDAAKSSAALTEMKAACKGCHSKFK